MSKRSRTPLLIFLAVVALSIAACATTDKEAQAPEDIEQEAFNDLRTEIRETIDDSTRQTMVISHVDQLQIEFKSMRSSLMEGKSSVRAIFADYDASRESFDELITLHDTTIRSQRKQVGESHRVLVESMTIDEWSALNKSGSKAMNTLLKSLQSL
jgi:Flp pilus assembly protein TadD